MILKVAGKKISDFNFVNVELKYDSVASTFSFSYRYDPNNEQLKNLNQIGKYNKCTVEYNDEILITGYILNHGFIGESSKNMTSIAGYSLPGVLEDCEIPVSLYPLQSDGLSLEKITQKLIKPFGISLIIDSEISARASSAYEVSTAEASQKIKAYLAELASFKDIILSHDEQGRLLLTKAKTKQKPIFEFNGNAPETRMTLTFNGQGLHSEITALAQVDSDGEVGSQETVKNPLVSIFRPSVIVVSSKSEEEADVGRAARAARADELKSITLDIDVDTWVIDGKVLRPNTTVGVINSEVGLKKRSIWFVESVIFSGNESSQTATLKCVMPETHNGQEPKNIFE